MIKISHSQQIMKLYDNNSSLFSHSPRTKFNPYYLRCEMVWGYGVISREIETKKKKKSN